MQDKKENIKQEIKAFVNMSCIEFEKEHGAPFSIGVSISPQNGSVFINISEEEFAERRGRSFKDFNYLKYRSIELEDWEEVYGSAHFDTAIERQNALEILSEELGESIKSERKGIEVLVQLIDKSRTTTNERERNKMPIDQKARPKGSMRKVSSHIREDWYKYVLQAFVVFSGIMIAFGLERWHANRLEHKHLLDAYELIAEEIRKDTTVIGKNLRKFESRRYYYESLIEGSLTRLEYDSCYFCPRIVTSFYFVYPMDKGFQHLVKQASYQIGITDTLNNKIETYYSKVSKDVPTWQAFIKEDLQENIGYWKKNMTWYYKREQRPEEMIEYQFTSPEYKNMVYVQRNLIYKNYVPLLRKVKKEGTIILELIDTKLINERG